MNSSFDALDAGPEPIESRRAMWLQRIALGLAVGVAVGMFVVAAGQLPEAQLFKFYFNPYAWLSLAALACCVVALVIMARVKAKSDNVVWFLVYLMCLALGALAELVARVSVAPEAVSFWSALSSLPNFLAPAALYMFALSYTRPRYAKHIWTVAPLLITAFVLMFFDYRTGLLSQYRASRLVETPWGGMVGLGVLHGVGTLWILGLYSLAGAMFWLHYLTTKNPLMRRQVRWFVVGAGVTVITGLITDVVVPGLGWGNLLPVMVIVTAVTGILYAYAILKYRFHSLNPLMIATNILDRMNEAVIGVKLDFSMDFTWPTTTQPLLFAAQGIGITPFYSMLKSRLHHQLPIAAHLFYTNRATGQPAPFQAELENYARQHPEFKLTLSHERLSGSALAAAHPELTESLVFVSGPGNLIDLLGPPYNLPVPHLRQDFFPNYAADSY